MVTKTEKYELRKKEDNDFYNIDDFNDNMDKIETALTEFDDSGSADGITSFTDMLKNLVTGNKLAVTLRNLKAGLQFVLHTGSIVNNCVTDNAKLPLSAAQGKALQDAIAKLNGDLLLYRKVPDSIKTFYDLPTGIYFLSNSDGEKLSDNPYSSTGTGTFVWVYRNNGNDERVGLLLTSSRANTSHLAIGWRYGGSENKLTWDKK